MADVINVRLTEVSSGVSPMDTQTKALGISHVDWAHAMINEGVSKNASEIKLHIYGTIFTQGTHTAVIIDCLNEK